ncbi:uncharacterized protein [Cherax quadricarinatus]
MVKIYDLFYSLALVVLIPVCVGDFFDKICKSSEKCCYSQSGLCNYDAETLFCNAQLRNTENKKGTCEIRNIKRDCSLDEPSFLSRPQNLLFSLRMYFHLGLLENRSAFNLTFPSPTWKSLKFRYQKLHHSDHKICRQFILVNELADDLMYDCLIFQHDKEWDIGLTVISNEGKGGKYYFSAPRSEQIDPCKTKVQDWKTFFFLHMDHVGKSPDLPVTMQLSPFSNVSYNISLVECANSTDQSCSNRTSHYEVFIGDPQTSADCEGDQCTVYLTLRDNPGRYAVTAQIVSPECPNNSCFISVSPTFSVEPSQVRIWITVAFGFALSFILAFALTLHCHIKQNRNLFLGLKEKQPTVLLIYLAENQRCWDLVNMLAVFLKEVCYVYPYVIDNDVGSQDPNFWTSKHMNQVDRLVFLVPGDPDSESVTPIRDHWTYALKYFTGHYFATHQVTDKVATVIFPFSADVPSQIANVQHFKLVQDMDSLVTWIHHGTWLDCKLLWGPQIKSQCQKNVTYTLSDITKAVGNVSLDPTCHNDCQINKNSDGKNVLSDPVEGMYASQTASPLHDKCSERQNCDTASEVACDSSVEVFDPEVPDIELSILGEKTSRSVDEQSSDESSDEVDDSIFL